METLFDIFKGVNNQLTEADLICVSELFTKEGREKFKNEIGYEPPTEKAIKDTIDILEIDIKDMYYSKKSFYKFMYYKMPVMIDIYMSNTIDAEHLKLFVKDRIDFQNVEYARLVKEKQFSTILAYADTKIQFEIYKRYFNEMSNEDKYELFIDIYTKNEFDFSIFEPEFIKEVYSYKTKPVIYPRSLVDKDGYVNIFRGQGAYSTPVDKAYSWTIDFNTAVFFATKQNNIDGIIYKAKVHKDNILDYLIGRREFEVIVLPQNVEDIKEIEMYKTKELLKELEETEFGMYYRYASEVKAKYFFEPHGMHGTLHTKRVLLLNILMAMKMRCFENEDNKLNLDDYDIPILIICSIFHDIGRTNNSEDEKHGKLSYKKMKKLNLSSFKEFYFEDDEWKIIKYIIENHCINDSQAIFNVHRYDIEDELKAIDLLKIFKDADGLDRIRLGRNELDINYLRTNTAKKLVLTAHSLLHNIK